MNSFIYYPLFLLLLIAIFTQMFYGASEIDLTYEGSQSQTLIANQTLNTEESQLEIEQGNLSLDFTMTTGIIVIIVGAIVLGLIGINVLGSGLSDYSIKIIWNGIVFYGLWFLFSALGFNFFNSIPIIGIVLWISLTLVYSLGVFQKMGS